MSSKRLSMFPLRLPSFNSEKGESPQSPDIVILDTPSAGTTPSTPSFDGCGDEAGEREKKVTRRKSRLGVLESYFSSSLTAPSADHLPNQQITWAEPHPVHPSAVGDYRPPSQNGHEAPDAGFTDPALGYVPPPPSYQQHARVGSLPNLLRKVRVSSGESEDPRPHQHTVAPQHPYPTLAVPSADNVQHPAPVLRKNRAASTSSSHDRGSYREQEGAQHSLKVSGMPNTTRLRSSSAQPPTGRGVQPDPSRIVSTPANMLGHARDPSMASLHQPESGKKLKKGWLRSSSGSQDTGKKSSAWILGPGNKMDYNTSFLANGERIPELWDETGDVYVFMGSRTSRYGPSFRVSSYVISPSRVFSELIQADTTIKVSRGRDRERNYGARSDQSEMAGYAQGPFPSTGGAQASGEANIYLDILDSTDNPDVDRLVAARNLFAFLTGQELVYTSNNPNVFKAFLQIASLLKEFGYSSYDGSSFGEPVDVAFAACMEQYNLGDIRHSREKTIEALILGEHMRSAQLYTEGFVHAVGKYDGICALKSPLWNMVSNSTRLRIERAHLDLKNRRQNIEIRLEAFEVPSLFAGVASSTAYDEYQNVRFKEWQRNYLKMRSFVLGYYKELLGSWPPKARSKKNPFSESGLHRMCLKTLYSDMCGLYDLLVDRDSITPRVMDQSVSETCETSFDPRMSALRHMLTEYDQSAPPVLPPIPYDVPKLPSMTAIREDYNELPAQAQAQFDRNIPSHELLLILIKSHNIDTDQLKSIGFLNAFKDFEQKEAKSCGPQDMVDQRIGYWLFLYVVLQALPMLVVDAPGLQYTEGVEYFLCEPPQGNFPWMEDVGEVRKVWYEVAGGQNIVELSADVVMFSVEATYHRSHCWLAAKQWEAEAAIATHNTLPANSTTATQAAHFQPEQGPLSPLEPPRAVFQGLDPVSSPVSAPHSGASSPYHSSPTLQPVRGSRNASPAALSRGSGHPYRSSIAVGPVPLNYAPPDRYPSEGAYGLRSRSRGGSGSNSRPGSASSRHRIPRNGSIGTGLNQLAKDSAGEEAAEAAHKSMPAATFDDILAGIEKEKGGKGKKKKGFF